MIVVFASKSIANVRVLYQSSTTFDCAFVVGTMTRLIHGLQITMPSKRTRTTRYTACFSLTLLLFSQKTSQLDTAYNDITDKLAFSKWAQFIHGKYQ